MFDISALPKITPLQFLVLSLLVKSDEIAGRELRELLSRNGVKSSGPQFYQLMARLEDAGYVEGWYAQKEIENQVVNERRYRIAAAGLDAWREVCDFYTAISSKVRDSSKVREADSHHRCQAAKATAGAV